MAYRWLTVDTVMLKCKLLCSIHDPSFCSIYAAFEISMDNFYQVTCSLSRRLEKTHILRALNTILV